MKSARVAIHERKDIFDHSILWTAIWKKYCIENNIVYDVIDCYAYNVISKLKNYDILLFNINNYVLQDMKFARGILWAAKKMGLLVFPDFNDCWHFDDKVSESYILQAINAPIPKYRCFYTFNDVQEWLNRPDISYPFIAKLMSGAGSHNVNLIKNKNQALSYAHKMFNNGISSAPSIAFKAKSQLQSSENIDNIKKRVAKIPEFIHTYRRARLFSKERGYAYFQEFIPNNGYDLKIVVIGDKMGFICRKNRKNDFRASGGGCLYYDRSLLNNKIIKSSFEVSDRLGCQCMGYDYIINNTTDDVYIIEMSYNFSHKALLDCNGYYNRDGEWINNQLNAPVEVLKNMLEKLRRRM